MERTEILENLKKVFKTVRPNMDLSTVTEESQLSTDLGMDSLSMLLVALAIEGKFNIRFDAVAPFKTVGEVIDFIITKQNA